MKGIKYLLVLLLIIPFGVKAVSHSSHSGHFEIYNLNGKCEYSNQELNLTLVLDLNCNNNSQCIIEKAVYRGQYWDDTNVKINPNEVLNGCPNKIGITNISGSTMKINDCSDANLYASGLNYVGPGCFTLTNSSIEENHEIKPSDRYNGILTCKDEINYVKECGCMPAELTTITSRLYNLLKIVAPVLLLIVGGFEMIKAMTAQDESAIKKAQKKLVNKFIAAAIIFLIFTIIQLLVSLLQGNQSGNIMTCLGYLLNEYKS